MLDVALVTGAPVGDFFDRATVISMVSVRPLELPREVWGHLAMCRLPSLLMPQRQQDSLRYLRHRSFRMLAESFGRLFKRRIKSIIESRPEAPLVVLNRRQT
jgi:hypothetical protein